MSTKYYQMLWNCDYCGAKGLLAKDQKICPTCGGKQDASKRYFPDMSAAQEVVGHVVKGVDLQCASCQVVNVIDAKFCRSCGASMVGAQQVARQADIPQPANLQASIEAGLRGISVTPKQMTLAIAGVILFFSFFFVLAGIDSFFTTARPVIVTDRTWQTSIQLEEYGTQTRSYQCSQEVSHPLAWVTGEELVSPAPTWSVQVASKHDNGDGTFSVHHDGGGGGGGGSGSTHHATTHHKSCSEEYQGWGVGRSLEENGSDLPVRWSDVSKLDTNERVASKKATWKVMFQRQDNQKTFTCEVTEAVWMQGAIGSKWSIQQGPIFDSKLCEDIAFVSPR